MQRVGYIRVSSKDQNPSRQFAAMEEYGILKEDIYLDMISGRDFVRPSYQEMLTRLNKGDLLVIKSVDRLGRNYGEILEQWRFLTKELQVGIEVMDMPLLNTTVYHNDLTGTFISDLSLQILAYVAETERTFIKQRQAEGIAIAKQRGVHFGCNKKALPKHFQEYYEMWKQGRISIRKAAEQLQMSPSTFYRRCKEHQEN